MRRVKGIFITFEGTEGSGKSTQIELLARTLRAENCEVLVLREPGGTSIGETIRAILKNPANSKMTFPTELLLMNASRAQLVQEAILPALEAGRIVLCDRFADSTVAYQAFGRGLDRASVESVIRFATGGLEPDLTLALMVSLQVSEARRKSRLIQTRENQDRFEEEERAFFERVQQGYEYLLSTAPARIKRIDASAPVETVQSAIWSTVSDVIPRPSAPKV